MTYLRLNLTALRSKYLFNKRPERVGFAELSRGAENVAVGDNLEFSRRQVLKSAGLAAVAMAPALKSAKATLLPQLRGPFRMEQQKDCVTFYLGNRPCWTIDVNRFSAVSASKQPKLLVDRADHLLTVVLRDALYPGTRIPADFALDLKPKLTECTMHLRMSLGGFSATGPFERWLAGDSTLSSEINLDSTLQTSDPGTRLQLSGAATATFQPNWKVGIQGAKIGEFVGFGGILSGDEVMIQLPEADLPSSIENALAKRTLLELRRGSYLWEIDHGMNPESHWTLDCSRDLFDRLFIEAVELGSANAEQSNPVSHSVILEQTELGDESIARSLAFKPTGIYGFDGSQFSLPLVKPRLATLFSGSDIERAFEAHYHPDPQWMHYQSCSFLIGAPCVQRTANSKRPDEVEFPMFELHAKNGILEHMHCEPALLKVSVPMAGAVVEPSAPETDTRMIFTRSGPTVVSARNAHGNTKHDPLISASHASPQHPQQQAPVKTETVAIIDDDQDFRFPANFIIGAIRPADLLVLKFEFLNMEFSGGKNGLQLVRSKATDPNVSDAYLIVHFPPQNIAEQAFFETSGDPFTKPDPKKMHPPAGPTYDNSTPPADTPTVPAAARLAGQSRLAFYLPQGIDSLPYSLQGLLDWSKLQPSLVPVAFPPPPPPLSLYYLPNGSYGLSKLGMAKANLAAANLGHVATQPSDHTIVNPNQRDIRYRPQTELTLSQSASQSAIENIQKNTKSKIDPKLLNNLGLILGQKSSGFSAIEKFPPIVLLDLHIRKPHLWETSIESPWRLMLSPNYYSGWAHSKELVGPPADPATKIRLVELWHTRLGVKQVAADGSTFVNEQDDYYRTLRAVWSPDYNPNDGPGGSLFPKHFDPSAPTGSNMFRMSLDARDRHELVTETSDYINFDDTDKRFIRADRLMLSALGSWMNTRGAWDVPNNPAKPLSLEEWRHRATMGRDHYVRVVYKGFLFPFGHEASLVKVTERKFEQTGNYMTAFLRQRMFIVVRKPLLHFPVQYQTNEANQFPFTSIELTTLVTPNIDAPGTGSADNKIDGQQAFWACVGGNPFLFHAIGTDWEGNRVEFTIPLAYIDNIVAYDGSNASDIASAIKHYTAPSPKAKVSMAGHKIAYASSSKPGDTTFETSTMTFSANAVDTSTSAKIMELMNADQPAFYPVVAAADLHIEAVKQITGMAGATAMMYNDTFVQGGWDKTNNPGEVFLRLVDSSNPIGLSFGKNGGAPTDSVGGFVTPNMGISALSRLTGPVSGDIASAEQAIFKAEKFFEGLNPDNIQLFGGITLGSILGLVPGYNDAVSSVKDAMSSALKEFGQEKNQLTADALALLKLPTCPVPSYVLQSIYDDAQQAAQGIQNALKIPKQVQILFKWDPTVQEFGPYKPDPPTPDKPPISLTALIVIPITSSGPGAPSYTVYAAMNNFTIDLFGIIGISFNSVTFKKEGGKKADVNADVKNVAFEGPLEFVNDLENIIPSDGFSDPPELKITPTGITIGYSLGIPSVSVGAFSLENISLGAELTLPFTGDPVRFRFHFCTQDNPFLLTIYCFGGGGFFGIELGMDGVEMIEASFEFGAELSLDFGVASGGVSVMAGIYFKLTKQPTGDECLLTGFVKMHGELEVLGIITITVDFDLSLTYDSGPPKKAWGEVTVSVSVKVLFFSVSVSMTARKDFVDPALGFKDLFKISAGTPDDPSIQWAKYRLAYMDEYLETR